MLLILALFGGFSNLDLSTNVRLELKNFTPERLLAGHHGGNVIP